MRENAYLEIDPRLLYRLGPAAAQRRRDLLVQTIEHWAEQATAAQRIYAPTGESAYIQRHIQQAGVRYSPGGFGGGGEYAISTGVRRGMSQHPLYVHFGTANLEGTSVRGMAVGGTGSAQGRIYPKQGRSAGIYTPEEDRKLGGSSEFRAQQRQPVLTFQKKGEGRRFRAFVSGQKPNPFVYYAFLETSVYAKSQLHSVARGLF